MKREGAGARAMPLVVRGFELVMAD
jgi:hypothetical protein